VILAPDSLTDVYQRLADLQTKMGRPTVVRGIGTIRSLDPRSNDLPQAMRSFLLQAYQLWGTKWAILAGDNDTVPMRMVRVQIPDQQDIPTDTYYSDLDGTWDANGNGIYGEVADSLDMNPDLWVGRLSAETRTDANAIVDKLTRYMTNPPLGALGKSLYLAAVLFPQPYTGGQVQDDGAWQAESLLVRAPGCVAANRYYQSSASFPGSLPLTKAAAMTALTQGYSTVVHVGHGASSQLSLGAENITSSELGAIDNGDSATIWIANNCASAAVDYDCVGEHLLRRPNGGALAYIGSTRDSYDTDSQMFSDRLFEQIFGTGKPTLGEGVEHARGVLIPNGRIESTERLAYFETVLLGSPSMTVWKCPPGNLAVTVPASVPLNAGSMNVTVTSGGSPVDSALVVAWKTGEDYHAVYTNTSGQATLPFHPATTGKFSLAFSAPGKLPYLDSLTVTTATPAIYTFQSTSVRDDLGGDADGTVEAGESFGIGGTIKNAGGTTGAGSITLTLQAVTSGVAVDVAGATVSTLAAGAQSSIPTTLRAHALATPNAARSERVRLIASDGVRADTTEIPFAVGAPLLLIAVNTFSDTGPGGNGNGILDPGETASLAYTIGNDGGARARGATLQVQNPAAGVTILDSSGSLGDVLAGGSATSAALRFSVTTVPTGRMFDLKLQDQYGHTWIIPIERNAPPAPGPLRVSTSSPNGITIAWDPVAATDVAGYRIYRGPNDGSALQLLTTIPIRRSSNYENIGLSFLTSYRYQVTATDSSGNEGARSPILTASTTPADLTGWPTLLGQSTSSNVLLTDLDGDHRPEVLVGAEYLYVFRPDGSDFHDGDQNTVTTGVFSTLLHNIASSPAAADLDGDGYPEIVAASWNDSTVAVFKRDGTVMPGWPKKGAAPFWSVPAIGDIDGDGKLDIVIGSNTSYLYAWHANGKEVRDGDSNPATDGVYFVPVGTVISSPAIADIDRDTRNEIVFGTSAGRVYALRNGAPIPGWPFVASGTFSSSPAIGDIVPGGGLEIAIASSNDSVYVLTSTGTRAPGWPRPLELTPGNGRVPSPVLAPLRKQLGDNSLDVVICGEDGTLTAFDPSGNTLAGWPVHLNAATEATPAIADLDGDGSLEILIGAEDRRLYAFHFDGTPVNGFPIETGAEVRSTPAVWDLDGDGSCDIVFAGWDRYVYAVHYPGAFHTSGMAWPMFHHDGLRTGLATFPVLTGVEPDPAPPSPPAYAALHQNRPNPFNPETRIAFEVPGPRPERVTLRVYTAGGQLVRTLVSHDEPPGYHEVRWDGRDARGLEAASGVYLYRAEIGHASFTRKMTLLR